MLAADRAGIRGPPARRRAETDTPLEESGNAPDFSTLETDDHDRTPNHPSGSRRRRPRPPPIRRRRPPNRVPGPAGRRWPMPTCAPRPKPRTRAGAPGEVAKAHKFAIEGFAETCCRSRTVSGGTGPSRYDARAGARRRARDTAPAQFGASSATRCRRDQPGGRTVRSPPAPGDRVVPAAQEPNTVVSVLQKGAT